MKRSILICFMIIALGACKKAANHNPDVNTFQITVNGKTYSASDNFEVNTAGQIIDITPAGYYIQIAMSPYFSPPNTTLCNITCDIAGKFQFNFSGLSDSANTRLGGYNIFSAYALIDSVTGAQYSVDSPSVMIITEADSDWIAGTLAFSMTDLNGNSANATGSFRISARN